jgi:hypothetical protein
MSKIKIRVENRKPIVIFIVSERLPVEEFRKTDSGPDIIKNGPWIGF